MGLAAVAQAPLTATAGTHQEAVRAAVNSILEASEEAERDWERPVYHFRPPSRYFADCCGLVYKDGWHHLFYQCNPYASQWERAHWGHARSRDMVHWDHLPVALAPENAQQEWHVFTGTAWQRSDGQVILFYQSIRTDSSSRRSVRPAFPADDQLTAFRKTEQVLVSAADHEPYEFNDWSDPYLVEHAGSTYMVCGGNARASGGQAVVHLYKAESADLMQWRHLGRLFCHLDRAAITMECPGLMKIGEKWVLWGCSYRPCDYWTGQVDFERMVFVPERYGIVDAGSAYAGRLIPLPGGRIVVCQHVNTMLPATRSWNNVMAMPRLADLDEDGVIRQKPLPEFEQLRGPGRSLEGMILDRESRRLPEEFSGDSLEFQVSIRALTARTAGLRLRSSPNRDPGVVIQFYPDTGSLAVNNRWAFYARKKEIRLRVFLDRRVVEVFTEDGLVGLATVVNADRESLGIECFVPDGSAEFHSFEMWPMSPARFSMEHFEVR